MLKAPKSTIPLPRPEECPTGPTSMAGLFKWPQVFLVLLCHHFGPGFIQKRLKLWDWDVATSFSGVGCAEHVP